MKKVTLFTVILFILMSFSTAPQAGAEAVVGEKLWTVKTTLDILNTEKNLSKVQLVDDKGNEVPTIVKVNKNNVKVLEVYADKSLTKGNYTLEISEEFSAVNGERLATAVEKNFTVESQTTTQSLNGTWKTIYSYKGIVYEILATFTNGKVDIIAVDTVTKYMYETKIPENYTVIDGQMNMKITDLKANLNGQILFYNADKFKIETVSGKEAFFVKQ